ncbi:MAG: UDP-galactose-4-epimerase [Methanosaeta sp. PtaU1.Bin060]|nr:MAG: UDP-galactose-4-epimerase [Methanosaeta sp. PtaU1.Bin060]
MFDDLNILVTGGTGSFGRKFTETLLRDYSPRRLVIFSRGELKQHEMRQKFPDTGNSPVRYFIGDVRDRERLYRAFNKVDVVIHAAALKQVPACEYNPFEAVQTNILGARNVIDAAIDKGVEKVMAISTDKAVNPINLYGATKLCAEKMFVQANAYSGVGGTRFSVCRYGNVMGSRGSVIPLFKKQRECGTVTVTDPRMTRFLITLEHGVRFVMECTDQMHGGEVFVPKIPSAKITDLTEAIAPGCSVSYIGIRGGEKLHEVLVSEDEARHTVEMDDKYVILPSHPWWKMENWSGFRKMEEGSSYSSNANTQWLSVEELRSFAEEGE